MVLNDNRRIIAVADPAALAKAAAERLLARIANNSDRVAICLTGGSSPKRLYELLGNEPYHSQIPWDRVHWFIGDERFVAADDPRNNMAMARQAFLDACAPAANVHPIPTDTAVVFVHVKEKQAIDPAKIDVVYNAVESGAESGPSCRRSGRPPARG